MFGGNNRAQVFFNEHGWTDRSKIEAMYTSRAADFYRKILSMEVAKAMLEETSTGLPEASNGVPSYAAKEELPPKESEATSATCSPSTFKKPICAQNLSHVASPKSSSFSEDFGSSSSSSKVIVSPVF